METKGAGEPSCTSRDRTVNYVSDDRAVSTAVIETLAEAESVPPTDLDVTLYDELDLDALDDLCRNAANDLHLSFSVDGYAIRVHGGRKVVVERQ